MEPIEVVDAIRANHQVEPFVIRVDEAINVWFPSGKWQDLRTGERGQIPLKELALFIDMRLRTDLSRETGFHHHACQACGKTLAELCDCDEPVRMEWCSARCRKSFDL
jgi:hypothetical protein